MTQIKVKMFAAGAALMIAVGFLAVAGVREGWVYYLQVDQFLASPEHHDKRVRLHGSVGEANLVSRPAELTASFDLLGETGRIRVDYHGVVPDLFKIDVDVVVEGQLNEAGVFQADTLMTKCASKYETAEGEAPHAEPCEAEMTP